MLFSWIWRIERRFEEGVWVLLVLMDRGLVRVLGKVERGSLEFWRWLIFRVGVEEEEIVG